MFKRWHHAGDLILWRLPTLRIVSPVAYYQGALTYDLIGFSKVPNKEFRNVLKKLKRGGRVVVVDARLEYSGSIRNWVEVITRAQCPSLSPAP